MTDERIREAARATEAAMARELAKRLVPNARQVDDRQLARLLEPAPAAARGPIDPADEQRVAEQYLAAYFPAFAPD